MTIFFFIPLVIVEGGRKEKAGMVGDGRAEGTRRDTVKSFPLDGNF